MFRKPQPAPFAAPPVTVNFHAYAGTPLTGPTAAAVSIPPADQAWRVRITLTAVEHAPPAAAGSAIGGKARLVVASRGGEPVSPSDRLLAGARLVDGTGDLSVGKSAVIDDRSAVLIGGTTLALSAADSLDVTDPVRGDRARRLIGVMVHRPAARATGDAYTVAVEWQDLYTPPPPYKPGDDEKEKGAAKSAPTTVPAAAAPDETKPRLTREVAVVDRTLSDDADAFTVVFPVHFTGTPAGGAVIARVEVRAKVDGDADQAALLAATEKELAESRTSAASLASRTAYGAAASSATDVAMAALELKDQRRKGLVFLAAQTGAALCEDAALVADDPTLAAIADAVRGAMASAPKPHPDGPALGWLLDRATFGVLGEQLAAERLSPELTAVLSSYAGEAGRHASSVELIGKAGEGAATRDAFDAQLVAENLIFLEDNSPASRVRAYDWLAARRIAPADYNPLGSARERRLALDRALNAPATTQPAAPTPAPAPATQPSVNPNATAGGGMP